MWPFLSHALFPPPTEAWLQAASSDPEAQGWGACSRPEKTPLESGGGGGQGERRGEAEEDDRDASFLLSLLEPGSRAESPGPDQELEAIKLKLWALEQVKQRPEPPSIQGRTRAEDGTGTGRLLSSPGTTGCPFPGTPKEKVEADHRSIYVGNVDYGGTARELEAHFHHCGQVHRVTILCDKFSGHPKGYAYIEFATKSSAQAAMELDESVFRGRVIKVLPKRTNFPGISSTDRGGLRGPSASRAAAFLCSDLQCRSRFRPRGQHWAHGRASPRFSPY
ncbi:embryonic polyadenylate-binding protein 2 isoform X2 [Marmota monax]|uniref:embryonic polyadenylate-binding protein 2 isoform X2 n=1 Tax=Marmota monax TaxID=9995 RepID=UPI0026EDD6D1|nr:embryonic polyadenylate-binding protein 2 isoform X2 [Marmota monax]